MILHHEFIRKSQKLNGHLAIDDRMLNKKVTYGKALIASLILAKKFSKFNEGEVGIMIPTSAGAALAVLGVVMAGKVPAMINYSTGAADNCRYAQKKCGFKTIITSKALLERINCPVVPGMVFLEEIMAEMTPLEKISAAIRAKLPASLIIAGLPTCHEDDNVVILFTSGSEKDPKAVPLTHKNLATNIRDLSTVFDLREDDVVMSILPLFHVFGFNANLWMPLMVGATSVTYPNPLEYKKIPKLVKAAKATLIAATPIFFAGYLKESETGDFEHIRIALPGADKTTDALRQGYRDKHGIELCEAYGTTETSPGISVNTPTHNRPGSIGLPLPSVQVKITDLETGATLGTGEEGKILVKGDNVMKGYLGDVEETSLRMHDGWYDTGDMGYMDEDGYLWHSGRLRRFVKVGGEMVSLVRTEIVLDQLLPEEVDCCVVDVPDSKKGARLVAAVTRAVDVKAIINGLRDHLPQISIPKAFVVIEQLPKMGSGKIDFRRITEQIRARAQG